MDELEITFFSDEINLFTVHVLLLCILKVSFKENLPGVHNRMSFKQPILSKCLETYFTLEAARAMHISTLK
jgi:hypothetical protein